MAIEDPVLHAISQEELRATAETSRNLQRHPVSSAIACAGGSRLHREPIRAVPVPRDGDPQCRFLRAAFEKLPVRADAFLQLQLAGARFHGCALFDVQQKKGCIFAFCDIQAAEAVKCNFATSSFERCDLYNVRAVECSFRGAQFHASTFSKALSKRSTLTKASFRQVQLQLRRFVGVAAAELRIPVLQILGGVLHRHRSEPCNDVGVRPGSGRVGPAARCARRTFAAPRFQV